jgi:hypothetical protein
MEMGARDEAGLSVSDIDHLDNGDSGIDVRCSDVGSNGSRSGSRGSRGDENLYWHC